MIDRRFSAFLTFCAVASVYIAVWDAYWYFTRW